MKFLNQMALAAAVVNVADAIELKRSASPNVAAAPIRRRTDIRQPAVRDQERVQYLQARAKAVNVDISNGETLYLINITLGTPPQALSLHLDTGSSDLWANVPDSSLCQSNDYSAYCQAFGTYDSSSSSTYKLVNNDFNITYADQSGATGNYVTDTFKMGSVTLDNFEFGVGTNSSSPEGILGVGYTTDEAYVVNNGGSPYPNVPSAMQKAGYTNTIAYSLWLNDLDSLEGTILFGGVDTDKYQGDLETFPVLSSQGVYSSLIISMQGIGINNGSISSVQDLPALLDSGTSLTYLPPQIADQIISAFNGEYDQSLGAARVSCDLQNEDGSVEYQFSSSMTISVPLSQLVEIAGGTNIDPICILGISPLQSDFAILGDTFLRNAYVVYDLSNNEISLAQTNFGSNSENILEITTSGVPNAKGAAGASGGSNAPTGIIGDGATQTVSLGSSSTHTSKSFATTKAPIHPYGALAVAGLGAVLAF